MQNIRRYSSRDGRNADKEKVRDRKGLQSFSCGILSTLPVFLLVSLPPCSDESGVEIVWQVYKAARLRKESATAHEKLCEYLHKTLETETAALLPPVTSERNRFGLVPSSLA